MTGVDAFLHRAGWSGGTVAPLPSDASDRSYCRVTRPDGSSAIMMSAPVANSDTAARQFNAFRRVGAWLRSFGLAAPDEFAADPQAGLLLLQDLGEPTLSKMLEHDEVGARDAYESATSVLSRIAGAPLPDWIDRPDTRAMAEMVGLTFTLLPGADALARDVREALGEVLSEIDDAPVVALRDVHGDNLIWRSGDVGLRRIGLLDFQDAVALPDGYDLASLVDDPRRVVPNDWRDALIGRYAAARGIGRADMAYRVELLSLQRNLRILGIFRTLATTHGRPAYARFLPRTRALIQRSAGHPGLHRLRPAVQQVLDETAAWEVQAA